MMAINIYNAEHIFDEETTKLNLLKSDFIYYASLFPHFHY